MRSSLANAIVVPALCVAAMLSFAQSPQSLSEPSPAAVQSAPVLHVYVNLMQIPVLLLDSGHKPLPPVPQSSFRVNIEGLKPFAPARVRPQGDDPISLAILLDRSEPDEFMWEKLGTASGEMMSGLHEHDRVEVYGIDGCKIRRYLTESTFNAENLQLALTNAAAARPYETQKKVLGPCAAPTSLWDALLYVGTQLGKRSGRRVMLTLSNGRQKAPPNAVEALHQLLNGDSTTLFSVQHSDADGGSYALGGQGVRIQTLQPMQSMRSTSYGRGAAPAPVTVGVVEYAADQPLQVQSEMSGGMLLGASVHSLPKVLAKVITLVRGRYIVEFQRPLELSPGPHMITVSAGSPRNFIRPAGITVPAPTAEERAADATVQHGIAAPSPPPSQTADASPVP